MKKFLLFLLVGFVGIISFCSASVYWGNFYLSPGNVDTTYFSIDEYFCFSAPGLSVNTGDGYNTIISDDIFYCVYTPDTAGFLSLMNSSYDSINVRYVRNFSNIDGINMAGSSCDSLQCQEDFDLIPISSVDTNYCVSNDLCPVFTGNNFSELIINDIVHESAPLINISIPQEYSWDYSVDENEFTLDISGFNVDYEYIDGIIETQNSKPTVEDFNKIISELLPLFVPGLVIILFLIFVFRFVKKVF